MKHLFENKAQYLNFRKAWAEAVNSPKAKSRLEKCDEWLSNEGQYGRYSEGTGVHRVSGWINAEHHILYNLLRNKDFDRGFTEPKKEGKIPKLPDAVRILNFYIKCARTVVDTGIGKLHKKPAQNKLDKFLDPFGDLMKPIVIQAMAKLEEI